jgi:hypothetical protein
MIDTMVGVVLLGMLLCRVGWDMTVRAFIPSYKCVEISGRNKRFHTYRIEVLHNDELSYLDKRYSDFLQLHKEVKHLHIHRNGGHVMCVMNAFSKLFVCL